MDSDIAVRPPKPALTHGDCAPVPEFRRLNYAYGQLLGVADFRAEQSYFREKMRLHNRCLHGYGVVCGLLVEPVQTPPDCLPAAPAGEPPPSRISIACGVALDGQGNELVVRRPLVFDVASLLGGDDLKQLKPDGEAQTLYVSLCYCEQPIDPIRPVVADHCGPANDCVYGKMRESVRVVVGLKPPAQDERCETCCTAPADCCLLLARIDGYRRGVSITAEMIHNEVRRRLDPPYQPTVITGINWYHGASYTRTQAESLFGTNADANKPGVGIELRFSRPVRASSFRRGVVDLWRVEGGKGRAGNVSQVYGDYVGLPDSGMVQTVRYRQTDEEALDYGDRILIVVRCAFILDHCCRPVDGVNVGGRLATLPDVIDSGLPRQTDTECVTPPCGYGPWTSGNGTPGTTFESWIIIAGPDEKKPTPSAAGGAQP
jgi:hypothetical protein